MSIDIIDNVSGLALSSYSLKAQTLKQILYIQVVVSVLWETAGLYWVCAQLERRETPARTHARHYPARNMLVTGTGKGTQGVPQIFGKWKIFIIINFHIHITYYTQSWWRKCQLGGLDRAETWLRCSLLPPSRAGPPCVPTQLAVTQ